MRFLVSFAKSLVHGTIWSVAGHVAHQEYQKRHSVMSHKESTYNYNTSDYKENTDVLSTNDTIDIESQYQSDPNNNSYS